MEITRPDLHASGFHALLQEADESFGIGESDRILAELGVRREALGDADAWFSLEFAEALMRALAERDPHLITRAMYRMLSPRGLGLLYPLFRAFGNPLLAYRQAAKLSSRLNKVGSLGVREIDNGHVELTYRPLPDGPREQGAHMCEVRGTQFSLIPTLFDLPPAQVGHEQCIARGNQACVYDVQWQEQGRRRHWRRWGAGLGAVAALGVYGLPIGGTYSSALGALGLVTAGYLAGLSFELRRALADRVKDLLDLQNALTLRTEVSERRYLELLHAKAEIDLKVEQRTAELREATQRLSETLDEIQALDRAKTDFFNNVSHELRSPLTLIVAPLEELVAGRAPPGGERAAFEAMHRNAVRLLRLINQLLDLAKIDAGEVKLAPQPTDLPRLLRGVLAGFEAAAEKKGLMIDLLGPADTSPMLLDPSWIETAVTNLVANAVRLSKRGGAVRVTLSEGEDEVRVDVADDGPGIAPADHARVFERFAQGDSAKGIVGGTGIGLALVREAVRLHGGDVTLESELGKGATFMITLPRRLQGEVDARLPNQPPSSSEPPPRVMVDEIIDEPALLERPGPVPTAPLVLVVEDNVELREFIANVLAARYRVRGARDGREGVSLARELRPDVVVSDVAMPEMDGYELCRKLRESLETRATPILLVTARTEVASVLEGFDAGANDYILKPFHGRELLARVDVHVRLQRVTQELAVRERHAMLGVLAASVAHQVRNPLTTLVSGLPAMRGKLGTSIGESTRQLIDVMIDCAERIERMTIDLMDLSRVDREAGGPYRPSEGLHAAIRLVRARLDERVVIEEDIEDAPVTHGRAADMNHVFLNLLDNAVRAVGETGRIRVAGTISGGSYVVAVGDSGPGIDPETAKHVFEPFFTTRPAGQGTGLGLAVAQQVLAQCGGEIALDRSVLGGAELRLRIPIVAHESERPPAVPTLH